MAYIVRQNGTYCILKRHVLHRKNSDFLSNHKMRTKVIAKKVQLLTEFYVVSAKNCEESLEDWEKVCIFAVRMRVEYRRDSIKLLNRSSKTKPWVVYLRL